MENLIEIKNLHATIDGKEILKGINLTVKAGEVHAIMGPNGSGKSTLSNVLVGHPAYTVTEGEVIYKGKDLLSLTPEERSHEGLFLSFQYPVEIPGVSITNFMRAAINAKRKYLGQEPMNATEFLKMMREKRALVNLDSKLANRSVNEGRFAHCSRRCEQTETRRHIEPCHYPLPTLARLYQTRYCTRSLQRTYSKDRRS